MKKTNIIKNIAQVCLDKDEFRQACPGHHFSKVSMCYTQAAHLCHEIHQKGEKWKTKCKFSNRKSR